MDIKKILIVEDEAVLRECFVEIFKKKGWDVYEAGDGYEGINIFKEIRPHFILTDINMPKDRFGHKGLNGIDMINSICDEFSIPYPEIFIMSGNLANSQDQSITKRINHYFEKPLRLSDALKKIEESFLKYSTQQES